MCLDFCMPRCLLIQPNWRFVWTKCICHLPSWFLRKSVSKCNYIKSVCALHYQTCCFLTIKCSKRIFHTSFLLIISFLSEMNNVAKTRQGDCLLWLIGRKCCAQQCQSKLQSSRNRYWGWDVNMSSWLRSREQTRSGEDKSSLTASHNHTKNLLYS